MTASPAAPNPIRSLLVRHYGALREMLAGRLTDRQVFQLFAKPCTADHGAAPDASPADAHRFELKVFDDPAALRQLADSRLRDVPAAVLGDAAAPVYPGGRIFVLLDGDRLVHYSRVIADRRDPNFGPFFRGVGEDRDICIGPCHTADDYRGHGVYGATLNAICHEMAGGGTQTAFIYTKIGNTASLKGISKAGFTPFARLARYRFLFWTFDTLTSDNTGTSHEIHPK